MSVEVRIPPVLRRYTGGAPTVTVAGATVGQVLENLERAFPGIKAQLFDGEGRLHRFINIYRNGEDIRYLAQLDTPVADGDVIAILPAVAGGAPGGTGRRTPTGR